MATTPPPPSRIRTPPTPLHGPKHDNYEPYSPRRSSRVAAQQRKSIGLTEQQQQKHAQSSPQKQRRARATTPTNVHRGAGRSSNQTFSPPSSPASPALGTPGSRRKAKASGESSHHLDVPHIDPRSMLPTPSKTPRKRATQTQASLSSTARVLFPGRTASVEDAMPEPRKARRSKHAFSLGSFEEMDGEDESEVIPIYTDSKERMPQLDEEENEDNPFVASKASKTRSPRSTRKARKDEKTTRMEQAMRNDEGVIVTFRGKKIFRKFDDTDTTNHATTGDNEQEEDTWSDLEIRRKAGRPGAASSSKERPFMRSSYKPRLLFPTEEQRRARDEAAADEADEEALTDIEVPIPQPSSSSPRRTKGGEATTPVKHRIRAVTPPTTIRKTRGRKLFEHSPADAMDVSPGEVTIDEEEEMVPDDQVSVTSSKKNSPFDTWRRTKTSSVSKVAAGKKREADALDVEGMAAASAAKRSRGVPSS